MVKILILLALAGMFNSWMDLVKYHYRDSVFGMLGKRFKKFHFWAGPSSHLNKYKDRDRSKGEAFFGSTTIFVFTTDAWHFFQMLWRVCFTLAVAPQNYIRFWEWVPVWVGDFIVNSLTYLIIFNLFYEKLFRTKRNVI